MYGSAQNTVVGVRHRVGGREGEGRGKGGGGGERGRRKEGGREGRRERRWLSEGEGRQEGEGGQVRHMLTPARGTVFIFLKGPDSAEPASQPWVSCERGRQTSPDHRLWEGGEVAELSPV